MTTTPTATRNRDAAGEAVAKAQSTISEDIAGAFAEVPANLAEQATDIQRYLTSLVPTAQGAISAADQQLGNLDIHPDGRRARAEAIYAQADAGITELVQAAETRLKVLEASLHIGTTYEATDPGKASLLRQDIATLIPLYDSVGKAFQALAADPDPHIRAMIVGPWGQRYAKAAGVSDAEMTLARYAHYDETAKGTDHRAQAARTLLRLKSAPSLLGSAAGLARGVLTSRRI